MNILVFQSCFFSYLYHVLKQTNSSIFKIEYDFWYPTNDFGCHFGGLKLKKNSCIFLIIIQYLRKINKITVGDRKIFMRGRRNTSFKHFFLIKKKIGRLEMFI